MFSSEFKAQTTIESENISIEIVKARKINATSIQFGSSGYNINSGKDNKRVQLRLKVRSLDKELTPLDPNKLVLINDKHQVRFSISEISFATFFRAKGFPMLSEVKPKEGKYSYTGYDPTIKNTFCDYSIKNYKDIQLQLNFGTKKKPNIKPVYFKPNTIDKNVLDAFFIVPNEMVAGKIYYGDILIGEIKYK